MALINTTTTGVLGTTVFGDGTGDLTIQQNGVLVNKITSNGLTYRGTGSVLQVVNTYYTTATSQSITSGTVNNITGLEAIITPASTSSRILIFIRWFGEHGTDNQNWETMFGITRDGTAIGLPAQPGSVGLGMAMASLSYYAANADSTPENVFYSFLDSPSTTSAVTYRAYATPQVTEVLYTNRVAGATTSGGFERGTSSIMLMEIAG